jgi:PHD/YefM family antitoxin component YafN of YafNO toxin-antitoxin module
MSSSDRVTTSAADLVRQFAHYSDVALSRPVVVTWGGKRRNVLISIDEYERLRQRDQQAFFAADTPEEFLTDLARLAEPGQ